ncbi:MAG TPA: hypothetical protein PLD82_02670 [Spirochaetota bacterium]|nr:hypothetical protein [Spirochaetota bacterium]
MKKAMVALCFCLHSLSLFSDQGPAMILDDWQGMNLAPRKKVEYYHHPRIRLVRERVEITLRKNEYSVKVHYWFFNNGPEEVLTVAFPFILPVRNFQAIDTWFPVFDVRTIQQTHHTGLCQFMGNWILNGPIPEGNVSDIGMKLLSDRRGSDDREYMRRYYKNIPNANYKYYTVRFPENKEKYMMNSYSSDYGVIGVGKLRGLTANYILETGRFWVEPVESCDVEVRFEGKKFADLQPQIADLSDHGIGSHSLRPGFSPEGYSIRGDVVRWHWRNVSLDRKRNIMIVLARRSTEALPSVTSSSFLVPPVFVSGEKNQAGESRMDFVNTLGCQSIKWGAPAHWFCDRYKFGMAYYSPYRLLDTSRSVCWAEGVPGPGIGEWVEVDFGSARWVKRFGIVNGLGINMDQYLANNRVKRAEAQFDNGTRRTIEFTDKMLDRQFFSVGAMVRKMRLKILDIYPGSRDDDTCLQNLVVE